MKRKNLHKAVVLATLASTFVLGCELIVDFDRTRIPVEGGDATAADVVQPPVNDAGGATDATTDGPIDADAGDAGADADAS